MFKITKFAVKLCLSVLIFNWILTEADTISPGIKDSTYRTIQAIAIPTHQELMQYEFPTFEELGQRLDVLVAKIDFREIRLSIIPEEALAETKPLKTIEKSTQEKYPFRSF